MFVRTEKVKQEHYSGGPAYKAEGDDLYSARINVRKVSGGYHTGAIVLYHDKKEEAEAARDRLLALIDAAAV